MESIEQQNSEDVDFAKWLNDIYDISNIDPNEFKSWVELYQYKGFNRLQVLRELRKRVKDVKVVQQIIIVCGLLGPQRASQVKIAGHGTIESMGIPASGLKGSTGVSCQRITAATADLCAFFLKQANVPKRLSLPCPAWLQFPSAGSITMSDELRQMHIEFARRFSTVIGGIFNEQIYQQMINNSYLDQRLNLFVTPVDTAFVPSVLPSPAPTFNPAKGDVGPTKTSASSSSGSSSVPKRT
jgi:hypothetical protein